jgi:perosamine synthetase
MIPRFKPSLCFREILALFRPNKGMVAKFENEFAQKFEAVDAVAFPYGRSAQWAFLQALEIENAEILMPSYTCSVVAHAVTLSGNKPRFVDIDLNDYNMNLAEAESLINERTRAIIATHTFGYPQDLDRLEAMVEKAEKRYGHKIWLMQDCCHAFGAQWRGRTVGTSGDVAIYAFNISKIMTSIFGGMLTFQCQDLANKVRQWRDANFKKPGFLKPLLRRIYLLSVYFAFNSIAYRLTWWLQNKTPLLNKLTKAYHLDEKIHFPPDYQDEMLDVEAAVGLVQLRKYPAIIERRRKKAKWYDQNLERRTDWEFPPKVEGATYSHYTIRVPNRNGIIDEYAQKGIHLGELIQYSIPHLSCYNSSEDYPNSKRVCNETINFPLQ